MRIRAPGVLLTLGALAIAAAAFFALRWHNSRAVDTWIGRQIIGVANGYLVPRIDFAALSYQAPRTVSLRDVTFTAPDGTKVIQADLAVIELAEVPRSGKPLRIRKIVLSGGGVNLVETTGGGFKGLVPFVRAVPGKESEKEIDEDLRLSKVLQLENVEIREVSVTYAPADGSPPMVLTGIALDLNVTRAPRIEPGLFGINVSFGRLPQAAVTAAGALNLDTLVAELDRAELRIDVNQGTLEGLPPALQSLLRGHDAQGQLAIAVKGRLPLRDALSGELTGTFGLTSFRISSGDYTFPIESGSAAFSLTKGAARIDALTLKTLGGEVGVTAVAHTSRPDRLAEVSWHVSDLNLHQLLREGGGKSKATELAGILNGSGAARTSLDSPKESLSGNGNLTVHEGQLLFLPGLREIADALNVAFGSDSAKANHTAAATFDVVPAGISITESEVVTEFVIAHAIGLVGFDKTLDLRVNAGPFEKLQSFLGRLGKAVGSLTDRIVTYRVYGTFEDPKVDVLPLGIKL